MQFYLSLPPIDSLLEGRFCISSVCISKICVKLCVIENWIEYKCSWVHAQYYPIAKVAQVPWHLVAMALHPIPEILI